MNQPTNQPINQSINQSINQPTNQSIDSEPIIQITQLSTTGIELNLLAYQPPNRAINRPTNQPLAKAKTGGGGRAPSSSQPELDYSPERHCCTFRQKTTRNQALFFSSRIAASHFDKTHRHRGVTCASEREPPKKRCPNRNSTTAAWLKKKYSYIQLLRVPRYGIPGRVICEDTPRAATIQLVGGSFAC